MLPGLRDRGPRVLQGQVVISIDPGNFEGGACWALWRGELQACGAWPLSDDILGDIARGFYDDVVCETQVIIPRFTKRPADIITLAQKTGAILAVFGWPTRAVKLVKPSSWKGSSPKPRKAALWKTYAIHRLAVKALSSEELAIYQAALEEFPEGEKHNLADSVGIGLDELGRLK